MSFDVDGVVQEVAVLLGTGGGGGGGTSSAAADSSVEGARNVFRQALMDWSDDYTENLAANPDSVDAVSARSAIAQLWIQFALMEVQIKKLSFAFDIFKAAIKDPIASACLDIYLAYTDLCRRNKKDLSEKLAYFEGLCCQELKQEDIDALWSRVLEYTEYSAAKSAVATGLAPPKISLEEVVEQARLQQDLPGNIRLPSLCAYANINARFNTLIKEESSDTGVNNNSNCNSSNNCNCNNNSNSNIDSEYMQVDGSSNYFSSLAESKGCDDSSSPRLYVASKANFSRSDFANLQDTSGITPETLMKIYYKSTPSLFNVDRSLSELKANEIEELEAYFSCSLNDIRSGDCNDEACISDSTILCLSTLEGLYIHQKLEEKQFRSWESELRQQYDAVREDKERELEHVRMELGDSHVEYVKAQQKYLKLPFHDSYCVKAEVLNAIKNKTLLTLLIQQQKVLFSLNFPYFTKALSNKFDNYMSLVKNDKSSNLFDMDPELGKQILELQRIVSAVLGLCLERKLKIDTASSSSSSSAVSSEEGNVYKRVKNEDEIRKSSTATLVIPNLGKQSAPNKSKAANTSIFYNSRK